MICSSACGPGRHSDLRWEDMVACCSSQILAAQFLQSLDLHRCLSCSTALRPFCHINLSLVLPFLQLCSEASKPRRVMIRFGICIKKDQIVCGFMVQKQSRHDSSHDQIPNSSAAVFRPGENLLSVWQLYTNLFHVLPGKPRQ